MADAGRPAMVEPALTTAGAAASLRLLDSELEAAEDALNAAADEHDESEAEADPARFAEVSAESRASAKAALKSISGLASATVEKAQQMLATVAHNKDMMEDEMVAEYTEKANDALSASLEALSSTNAKLDSLNGVEANAMALDTSSTSIPSSAPLPPPMPSSNADSTADADSDEMVQPTSAVVTAEQEQAPSHLADVSPTAPRMAQQHAEIERRKKGKGGKPARTSPGSSRAPKPAVRGRKGGRKSRKARKAARKAKRAAKKGKKVARKSRKGKKAARKNRKARKAARKAGRKARKNRRGGKRTKRAKLTKAQRKARKARRAARKLRCKKCRSGKKGKACRAKHCGPAPAEAAPAPAPAGSAAPTSEAMTAATSAGAEASPAASSASASAVAASASGAAALPGLTAAADAPTPGSAASPAQASALNTFSQLSAAEKTKRRACIAACPTGHSVEAKDCRQGCRGKIVCEQGPNGVDCRKRRRQLRQLRRSRRASRGGRRGRKARRAARRAAAATKVMAAPSVTVPGGPTPAQAAASAPAQLLSMDDIKASIQRLLAEEKIALDELRSVKQSIKRNSKKIRTLSERQWDDRNWWKADKAALAPLVPSKRRPVPPPKEDVAPPMMGGALSAKAVSAASSPLAKKEDVAPPPSMTVASASGKGAKNLDAVKRRARKQRKIAKRKAARRARRAAKRAAAGKNGPGAGASKKSRKGRKQRKMTKRQRREALKAIAAANAKYANAPRGAGGFPVPQLQANLDASKAAPNADLDTAAPAKAPGADAANAPLAASASASASASPQPPAEGQKKVLSAKERRARAARRRRNRAGPKRQKRFRKRRNAAAKRQARRERKARKAAARRARGQPAPRGRRGRRGGRRYRGRRGRGRRSRFAEVSAEEQARQAVREAAPHTYVHHDEEAADSTVLSSNGKPLHPAKMVDGYEVATLRMHTETESDENQFTEPTVMLVVEESVGESESKPAMVAVTIEDPKLKHRNLYTKRRCHGKPCASYIVPRYHKIKHPKGWVDPGPVQYQTPEFRVPNSDAGVTIHLRGSKTARRLAALSSAHVTTPNEEYLKRDEMRGHTTIAPEYVETKRALKKFFNKEQKAANKLAAQKKRERRGRARTPIGAVITEGLHAMIGKTVVIPEYAAAKPKHADSHLGVWHPAKLVPGTTAAFLQIDETETEEEESEEEADTESEDESEEEEEEESDEEEESEDESEEEESDESEALLEADASPKKKSKKAAAKKNTIEAAYRPRVKKVTEFQSVEYGDPTPAKTAAEAKKAAKLAATTGAAVHPTVFRKSFFSPLPQASKHVRCFGKGDRQKCYRVDQKTGMLLGKPSAHAPFVLNFGANGQPIETPAHHSMEANGFQEPEYDEKLALWKPKKSKLVKVPVPIISFSELHFEMAAADADAALEAESADRPRKRKPALRPTTTLTAKPTIVEKGKANFFGYSHRLPQFSNSKIEDSNTQNLKSDKYQLAAVHPPEFFKPPVGAQYNDKQHDAHPRFAAVSVSALDEASAEAAAALDATESDLENGLADEEAKAAIGTFFSEVKSLLSSKSKRA